MRAFLFLLFITPITCHGIGLESCKVRGSLDGKEITLSWIYLKTENIEGFGVNGSDNYGFCRMGSKGGGIYVMSCAASNVGKEKVYYETSESENTTYHCKRGCDQNIVQTFKLFCSDK